MDHRTLRLIRMGVAVACCSLLAAACSRTARTGSGEPDPSLAAPSTTVASATTNAAEPAVGTASTTAGSSAAVTSNDVSTSAAAAVVVNGFGVRRLVVDGGARGALDATVWYPSATPTPAAAGIAVQDELDGAIAASRPPRVTVGR